MGVELMKEGASNCKISASSGLMSKYEWMNLSFKSCKLKYKDKFLRDGKIDGQHSYTANQKSLTLMID